MFVSLFWVLFLGSERKHTVVSSGVLKDFFVVSGLSNFRKFWNIFRKGAIV